MPDLERPGQSSDPPITDKDAPDPMALEQHQPDPMLQMSHGRLNAAGVSLVAVAIVVILFVVLYGLNAPGPGETQPSAPSSTAAANSGGTAGPAQPQASSPSKG
jgi:hypothetical protein